MLRNLSDKIRSVIELLMVRLECTKWIFSKNKLPPGGLKNLFRHHQKDQRFLLRQIEKHGSIFKLRTGRILTICVSDLPCCRKLLREQGKNLNSEALDLTPLFPRGDLRTIQGDEHKKYRTILLQGIQDETIRAQQDYHESIFTDGFKNMANLQTQQDPTPEALKSTLGSTIISILLHVFYGAKSGTPLEKKLTKLYIEFWGENWSAYSSIEKKEGFANLRQFIQGSLLSDSYRGDTEFDNSIFGQIKQAGSIDETVLGNLIVMVKSGRGDLTGLLRWVTKYASENNDILDKIAAEAPHTDPNDVSLAKAFIMETLRMNQIETQLRSVNNSFVFEGYSFPEKSFVWLCIWESHKSSKVFSEPFTFRPSRFLNQDYTQDEYAPFGLGAHRCPFSNFSLHICSLFIKTLANLYSVEAIGNGPPSEAGFITSQPMSLQ